MRPQRWGLAPVADGGVGTGVSLGSCAPGELGDHQGRRKANRTVAICSVGAASLCAKTCNIDVAKQNKGRNVAATGHGVCVHLSSSDSLLRFCFGVLVEFDALMWFRSFGEVILS